MIAALPMYDRMETRSETDRFWSLIAKEHTNAPKALCRDRDLWDIWTDPQLFLAQTCGMPYRVKLRHDVSYVTTPDFGLPHCPAGYYNSVFLKRKDDTRDLDQLCQGVFAYNDGLSQSGWAGPVQHLLDLGLGPTQGQQSGAHRASAELVTQGKADFCAVDAQTWRLMQRYDPWTQTLLVIDQTAPTPALPYICSPNIDPAEVEVSVLSAFSKLHTSDKAVLGVSQFVKLCPEQYFSVATPPLPYEMFKNHADWL